MKKQPTFEESLTGLSDIVRKLEDRTITLEQAMELFEKGVTLIEHCQNELKQAEQRVTELSKPLNETE